jgi:hypothetical protein
MCQTVVRNRLIIPTIYTKRYKGSTVPINPFLPFLLSSEWNKEIGREVFFLHVS